MRTVRLLTALLLMLLAAPNLRAQWSGNVNATGGFGAVKSLRCEFWDDMPDYIYHRLGKGSARINYKSPSFQWSSFLEGQIEYTSTDSYHVDAYLVDDPDDEDGYGMKANVKMSQEIPIHAQYRSDATWRPAPGQSFSLWGRYDLRYSAAENVIYRAVWKNPKDHLSQEVPVVFNPTWGGGLKTAHELGSYRHRIVTDFSLETNDRNQTTYWTNYDFFNDEESDEVWASRYRLTPHSRITTYDGNIQYRDSMEMGPVRLTLSPGIRLTGIKALYENSGATLDIEAAYQDQEIWRDSTEIRECFRFSSMDFQPYMMADFSWQGIRAHLDYALSWYGRRLTDSTHLQGFDWQTPYPLGTGRLEWRFARYHRLTLSHNYTVKYPTYLQVCWYDRSSGYMDQLYRGNPELNATRNRLFRLAYDLNYKRFVFSTSISNTFRLDEIEQTWFKEVIDNRTYRIFTWINGADSWILGTTQRAGWHGKVLTANIGVDFNFTYRQWHEEDKTKYSNDWRVTADVAARLKKGWKISADVKYQSAVATFFSVFKEYCVLNARIQKDFKRISLSLEGRDLLDKPIESSFTSEDGTQTWNEKTLYNRRLILLGISWKF